MFLPLILLVSPEPGLLMRLVMPVLLYAAALQITQ